MELFVKHFSELTAQELFEIYRLRVSVFVVEQKCCGEWLQRLIARVDPAIIVCLGRIAATALIKDPFRITREHGQWFDVNGRRCMAIYHPSALLRDPSKRPETFVDLKALQREIYTRCPEVYPDA